MTNHLGIMQTRTEGYDPKANGLAEKYIGIIKGRAGSYLAHSKLAMTYWYWASMQATVRLRLDALDIKLAEGSPTFGDTIVVRRPAEDKAKFQERGVVATFLHWSPAPARMFRPGTVLRNLEGSSPSISDGKAE